MCSYLYSTTICKFIIIQIDIELKRVFNSIFIIISFKKKVLTSMSLDKFNQTKLKPQHKNNQQFPQKSVNILPKMFTQYPLNVDPSVKVPIHRPMTSKNSQPHDNQKYFTQKTGHSPKHVRSIKKLQAPKNGSQNLPRSKSKTPIKINNQIVRQQIIIQPQNVKFLQRGIQTFQNENPLLPSILDPIVKFQPAKHSKASHGSIKAYAASTNQGPVRQYNEDRVAIILNFPKPEHVVEWHKPYYFGVFDGHGGIDCADMLRDNLHLIISKEKTFPNRMAEAMKSGFQKYEKSFCQESLGGKADRSGSCALITFVYGRECFIGNLGDSRAIMSVSRGRYIRQLSTDHKASDEFQIHRVIKNGGKIYQTKIRNKNPNLQILYNGQQHKFVLGPHRVAPGRLSVTRTFGDIQAKMVQFGGNPKGIICLPEITSFTINEEDDFIVLACDGIYDRLSNSQVVAIVWDTFRRDKGSFVNLHEFCGKAAQNIMKMAFHHKTLDNITVVLIALEGLQRYFRTLTQLGQEKQLFDLNNHNLEPPRRLRQAPRSHLSFQKRYIGKSLSPSHHHQLKYLQKKPHQ